MTSETRNRLADKVYELYKRGATEGERAAAANRLAALLGNDLEMYLKSKEETTYQDTYENIKTYQFSYGSMIEKKIINTILQKMGFRPYKTILQGKKRYYSVDCTQSEYDMLNYYVKQAFRRYKYEVNKLNREFLYTL